MTAQTQDRATPHRVVILAGGLSHERDVSLRSGRRVADAMLDAGHEVTVRDVDAGLMQWLRALPRPPEQVYVVHGELAAADALRSRIQDELGLRVRVPQHGETVEV